jgi:hypothetical protein
VTAAPGTDIRRIDTAVPVTDIRIDKEIVIRENRGDEMTDGTALHPMVLPKRKVHGRQGRRRQQHHEQRGVTAHMGRNDQ